MFVPVRLRQLHQCTSNGYIQDIDKDMKVFCPIWWLHDWYFGHCFLQTIVSILFGCRPLERCFMHCHMKRCCYVSQVSDHLNIPSNLAQESAQCLGVCWRWCLYYCFHLVEIYGNSVPTNNMTQSHSTCYPKSLDLSLTDLVDIFPNRVEDVQNGRFSAFTQQSHLETPS